MTRKHPELPTQAEFLAHIARNLAISTVMLGGALGIGTIGYHVFGDLPWIDALLNAAMILTGMGPVDTMTSVAGKLFATAYALFSGVFFVTIAAVTLSPAVHRLLHRFHLEFTDRD
jgi:hypothetical protein